MAIVVVSSSCDLNNAELKKLGIEVIDVPVQVGESNIAYYANTSLCLNEAELCANADTMLNNCVLSGQDTIVLTENAKYDLTYKCFNNVIKSKNANAKLELIDCKNIGVGYGQIVYELGTELKNLNFKTAIEKINSLKQNIQTYVVPSKNISNQVGVALGVKTIYKVVGGELKSLKTAKGKQNVFKELGSIISNKNSQIMMSASSADVAAFSEFIGQPIIKVNRNPIKQELLGNDYIILSYVKKPKV